MSCNTKQEEVQKDFDLKEIYCQFNEAKGIYGSLVITRASFQQQHLQNKTLFNSCEKLLLGTLILDIDIGIKGFRLEQIV